MCFPLLFAFDERFQSQSTDLNSIQNIVTSTNSSKKFAIDVILIAMVRNVSNIDMKDRPRWNIRFTFSRRIRWSAWHTQSKSIIVIHRSSSVRLGVSLFDRLLTVEFDELTFYWTFSSFVARLPSAKLADEFLRPTATNHNPSSRFSYERLLYFHRFLSIREMDSSCLVLHRRNSLTSDRQILFDMGFHRSASFDCFRQSCRYGDQENLVADDLRCLFADNLVRHSNGDSINRLNLTFFQPRSESIERKWNRAR